ncbi:MAG: nascent polypeptide-associated complex protein [Candidatus Aenigmatarchaeota archaeon]
MMPNLDPSKIQKMMKQMGMDTEEIDALEVEIKTKDGKLLVKEPSVMKVNLKGKEMLQVEGEFVETSGEEREKTEVEFSEEDVETVVQQTGASKEEAREALEEEEDLAMAVMKLKE